jgi:translation initiation factor 2 subunit 1
MANEGRFYEKEFPELDEVVVVQVQRIVDMGAYVSLLEYNGREGMMLLSELSKRRIRSVAKLLKVGRTEVVMVLRADHEKGYIDLSKRRVDPEDVKTKDEQFAKAKAVYGIMRHVAHLHNIDVNELSKKVAWPLNRKYPDAHEALRKHINEELDIWKEIDFSQPGVDLSDKAEQIKEDIEVSLRRRLVAQALRMRAKIDVSCSQFEGIDAIKEALQKGFEASTEECKVKIQLIAHPLFMLTCMTREKEVAKATLEKAMELIKESIVAKGGEFIVRTQPELVGHDDPVQEELLESESGSEASEQSHMGDLDPELLKQLADAKGGGDSGSDEEEA